MKLPACQKGFCVTPLSDVLGVFAVLAIASFVLFPRVQAKVNSDDAAEHIGAIVSNIHKAMPTRNYTDLNTGWANQEGIFPPSMNGGNHHTGTEIHSRWGESVTLMGSGQAEFALTYHNTPSRVCAYLVEAVGQSFNRVQVVPSGGTAVSVKEAGGTINVDGAFDACTSADTAQVVFWGE